MPSDVHEERVALLENLARLAGYNRRVPRLPDGSNPDVLLSAGRRLFLGDAKATEHPNAVETRWRLGRYAAWLDRHARATGTACVFALCVEAAAQEARWAKTLGNLFPGGLALQQPVATLAGHRVLWVGTVASIDSTRPGL